MESKKNTLGDYFLTFKSWRQTFVIITILWALAVITTWWALCVFLPWTLSTPELNDFINVFVACPIFAVFIVILMKLKFKDSLYFRFSAVLTIYTLAIVIIIDYIRFIESSLAIWLTVVSSTIILICVFIVHFNQSVKQPLDEIRTTTLYLAKGDLTKPIASIRHYGQEYEDLELAYRTMSDYLVSIVSTIKRSSSQLAMNSEELASLSEEVNALSEEVAAAIQQISSGSSQQSELSAKAIDDTNTMAGIVERSFTDIEQSLQVIEDIASQTNILALNAAIEAARAGEFGRGFAIVADNVRRLAEETKSNSTDINSLTDEIILNISRNVEKLQQNLQGFASQSEEFSASSEQVAAATEEQTAAMYQMTSAAQDLTKLAEELSQNVSIFRI